jgi:hypothetical protein
MRSASGPQETSEGKRASEVYIASLRALQEILSAAEWSRTITSR